VLGLLIHFPNESTGCIVPPIANPLVGSVFEMQHSTLPHKFSDVIRLKLVQQADVVAVKMTRTVHCSDDSETRSNTGPGHTSVNRFAAVLQFPNINVKKPDDDRQYTGESNLYGEFCGLD
jgi:hypothetical protein